MNCSECNHCDKFEYNWHCTHPDYQHGAQVLTPYITPEWCPLIKHVQNDQPKEDVDENRRGKMERNTQRH